MLEERTYNYVAIDKDGKKVKGNEPGPNENAVYNRLKAEGLTPKKITRHSDSVMQKEIEIPGFEKKAKLKSLALFTRQFALLIRTGIPIPEALQIVAVQTDDKVLKAALEDVHDDLERGLSLSKAMEKHPLAFPDLLVAIINVGESSGMLDTSLDSMAEAYKKDLEMRQKVRSAMSYPIIVLVIIVLVVAGMLIFIVPQFEGMFADMGADLPLPTQILVTISQNMLVIAPIVIGVIALLIILYNKFKNEEWLRSRVDMMKLKIPVFGTLNLRVSISRFSKNLSMMLDAGIPLTQAFKLVADTSNNWVISTSIEKVIADVELGKSLSASMEHLDVFPPMVRQLIAVGERTGSMSEMLDQAASFYDDEVEELTETLANSIEPFMIVILGGVVGGIVLALYLPMIQMMTLISEG